MPETLELHLARDLDVSYDGAEDALKAGPAHWMPGFEEEGERVTARLGAGASGPAGRAPGSGAPRHRPAVRLRRHPAPGIWEDERRPSFYPRLEGHLRLERGDEGGHCHFPFDARYTPPAGTLGESVDRAVLHRVADATVRDFFSGVEQRLEKATASA